VDVLKVNPNDALYDIVSKMLEMFQDNISTRIKVNMKENMQLLIK